MRSLLTSQHFSKQYQQIDNIGPANNLTKCQPHAHETDRDLLGHVECPELKKKQTRVLHNKTLQTLVSNDIIKIIKNTCVKLHN